MIKKFFFISLVFFIITKSSLSIETSFIGISEAKVRLISPVSATGFNNEIMIGLQYMMADGWKTYWKSPGAGGFPQEINFSNSHNVSGIKVFWPTPKEFSILGLNSLGYEKEVVFPISVSLVDHTKPVELNLDVHFLVCKDICIPGDAKLNLKIPAIRDSFLTRHAYLMEKYISLSPLQNDVRYDVKIYDHYLNVNDRDFLLGFKIRQNLSFRNPKIYIHSDKGLPVVKPEITSYDEDNLLDVKFFFEKTSVDLESSQISIHLSDLPLVYERQIILNKLISKSEDFYETNIVKVIFIALLGGLILNLMPCVLPVLSIKLLSTIKYSTQENRKITWGFISTSFGIIVSFIILSIILILIKLAGQDIGWGMQFQSPLFLVFISIVLLFFSLNLLGFYEIDLPRIFIDKLDNFIRKTKILNTDFFTGFFATLMATPCSAPFVGTAITFAFTQQAYTMVIIFAFMGIGMALPYIAVAAFPSVAKVFPVPGPWTNWVRFIMGLLLLGTLIWVGSILSNHFNNVSLYIFTMLLIIISVVFYLKKRKIVRNYILNPILILCTLLFFTMPFADRFKKKLCYRK